MISWPGIPGEPWYTSANLWYACSEPERPTDPYVMWHHDGCQGCLIKVRLVQKLYPDHDFSWLVGQIETGC